MSGINRIVLAYSGGLDTSVILRWLIETYGAEVICYCGDVGQDEDLAEVAEKVGEEHAFNPVWDYLEGCQWDGEERIDTSRRSTSGPRIRPTLAPSADRC